jgi:hypothetical protein
MADFGSIAVANTPAEFTGCCARKPIVGEGAQRHRLKR